MTMKNNFKLGELLNEFNEFELINPNHNIQISSLSSIIPGKKSSLSFINKGRQDVLDLIEKSQSEVIICDIEFKDQLISIKDKVLILVKDPKIFFSKIGNCFFVTKTNFEIHPTSVIHPLAKIHPNVFIGANCTIGNVEIEEGAVIYPNVVIYDNTKIGKNVRINSGTVIGAEGFGYNRDENGDVIQFPHIGGVIIEDNVDIGANTCIDRGALDNTIIKRNAKIDNLVHIAHNVVVGESAYVIANAMIGGSTKIGQNAYIAPSVSLKDQLSIGDNVVVGMAASVLKNINPNETWTGNPAREFNEIKAVQKAINNLINK